MFLCQIVVYVAVLALTAQKQILQTIVVSVLIFMMNYFFWQEIPANMLFHYKAVFIDITCRTTTWMVGTIDTDISLCINSFAAFPPPRIWTGWLIPSFAEQERLQHFFLRVFKTLPQTRQCFVELESDIVSSFHYCFYSATLIWPSICLTRCLNTIQGLFQYNIGLIVVSVLGDLPQNLDLVDDLVLQFHPYLLV